ncbi:DUF333 domain-containing protein [Bdellovibrio sp. BCCA]|uniref:DUF333 domain-containing protein n=1 Tax=Bdellovibrio sp. BCCA TaxID=3136281 RepID=UPI0030F1445F
MKLSLIMVSTVLAYSFDVSAASLKLEMYSSEKKKYETVSVIDLQEFKISKNCIKSGKPSCQAWDATSKKSKTDLTGPALGNPAARYCLEMGANNRILMDEKKREFDYCIFADGSMIDAWSLYNKHHK